MGKEKKIKDTKIIEKLKESEEHYRIFASYQHAISALRKFYIKEASFEKMLQKTVDLLVKSFGYYMAWYGELKADENVIIPKVWAGKYEKYLEGLRLELDDSKDAKCAMSLAIVRKEPFGYADLEHDKDFEKWRPLALKYGYRSNQAIPLIVGGKSIGAFLIYSTRPQAFSEIFIRYLSGIVNELATIIEKITERRKAKEELKKYREHLEEMVEERTAELKRINEQLKQTQLQLIQSAKMASVGLLATGVAHEINNPLSVILGEARMLLKDENKDKETKDASKAMLEQAERIKGITEKLLEFSRRKEPKRLPLDVNQDIEKSISLLSYQVKMEKIKIVKELNIDLPRPLGDENQLQEVFLNIMLNATQAMEEGGRLTIRTRVEEITKYGRRETDILKLGQRVVVIEFEDTGKGMDEGTLMKVFTPFFTTKEKHTGLGLYICRGIIENHKGIIEVQSKLGEGSTFIVKLPVSKEEGGQ